MRSPRTTLLADLEVGDHSFAPMKSAVFPGSFDPLTIGHLAVAEAALEQAALDEVVMVISRNPLMKTAQFQAPVVRRIEAIRAAARERRWLRAEETVHQLLVDIADPYDFLILGADKAAQLVDPAFYGHSEAARDAALARLPRLIVAPRPGGVVPRNAIVLDLPEWVAGVSSTAVRAGRVEWKA